MITLCNPSVHQYSFTQTKIKTVLIPKHFPPLLTSFKLLTSSTFTEVVIMFLVTLLASVKLHSLDGR